MKTKKEIEGMIKYLEEKELEIEDKAKNNCGLIVGCDKVYTNGNLEYLSGIRGKIAMLNWVITQ